MVEDPVTGFQPSGIGIPYDFLDGSSHEDFLFPIPKSDGHISMYIQIGMVYTAIDVVHAFIDVLENHHQIGSGAFRCSCYDERQFSIGLIEFTHLVSDILHRPVGGIQNQSIR